MGPTASGKTNLAIELVQRLPCEIINVDSAQIYRGMDIGTGKPDSQTLLRAPHRLLDILDPAQAKDLLAKKPKTVLLDVREPLEYDIVHIEGARLIPLSELHLRTN